MIIIFIIETTLLTTAKVYLRSKGAGATETNYYSVSVAKEVLGIILKAKRIYLMYLQIDNVCILCLM